MRIFEKLLGLLALGLIAGSYALAQDIAGSIRGTVTDGSGAGISNARVTAIQSETGLQRSSLSNAFLQETENKPYVAVGLHLNGRA
jgi:hypothetical protein